MNYTNKDYYDYILKIDNIDNSLHTTYQKILSILLKEGLDKPISDKGIKTFSRLFEIRKYELQEKELEYLCGLLHYDSAYRRLIRNDNGSYTVYPKIQELPTEDDLLQYYSLGLKMDTKEIIAYLEPLINEKKSKLKKEKIENYYGNPKYLILRAKAIYDAVTALNNRNDIEDNILVSSSLSNITDLLNTMLNTIGLENNKRTYSMLNDFRYELVVNKAQYDLLKDCYVRILEHENKLTDISNKIWQLYAMKNNGVFIHQLTENAVESDKMQKICTSFYSDNVNVITKYSNGNIGYAYPMNIDSTFSVCETDVGSWQVTKEQYIEQGVPERWQLDETNLWYEYPHHSKLFSPEYIEEQIITNNDFAEIVIDNRKQNIKPLYCFYTPNATTEEIDEINYLARKQGLEVKPLKIKEEMIKQ